MDMRLYIRAFAKLIEFYAVRHPYLAAFFSVWCAGSFYIGFISSWGLCAGMIITASLTVWLARKIWITANDFGSRKAKTERKLKKQREREVLLGYIKQGIK